MSFRAQHDPHHRAVAVSGRCFSAVVLAIVWSVASPAAAQLRIVSYNTAQGPRDGLDIVLEAIGEESVGQIARPVDVLLLQEQFSSSTTTQDIVDILNGIYGDGAYARATINGGPSWSDIRQGLVYNTNSVSILDQRALGVAGGSSQQPRQTLRYRLRPVGYDSAADFYVYNSHYKSNDDQDGRDRRLVEAQMIRATADALGEGEHVIYAGDFNMYRSSEPAYQELLSAGPGQANDPINVSGQWHNNMSHARWHTQSPSDGSSPGLVGGGIDDRFDFQLVTGEWLDGEGLAYIQNSYHTFGNNGSTYNDPINVGNSIAFSGITSFTKTQILNALASVSDHLPLIVDYQLPGRMEVSVTPPPLAVITGGSAIVGVNVGNAAIVGSVNGADELDYVVTGSGDVVGSIGGTDDPLGGVNSHAISFSTATPGIKTGQVNVTPTSEGVPTSDAYLSQNLQTIVLTHANGTFADSADVDNLEIDFGDVTVGSDSMPIAFDIFNLDDGTGFTAGLDLDSVQGSGDTDVLTTNIESFANLSAGGSSQSFSATLTAETLGDYSASYLLTLSDIDLAGATSQFMELTLTGSVVSATLDADFDADGDVDGDDFLIWQSNFGGLGPDGDADRDGDVDGDDFLVWQSSFGSTVARGSSAVPEPNSGLALLVLVVQLAACLRMRQNKGRKDGRPRHPFG